MRSPAGDLNSSRDSACIKLAIREHPTGMKEMPPLTYLQLAEKVLDQTHKPLSPTEIWDFAEKNQLSAQLGEQQSKRPASTLYGAMFTDSRDNPSSIFARIG